MKRFGPDPQAWGHRERNGPGLGNRKAGKIGKCVRVRAMPSRSSRPSCSSLSVFASRCRGPLQRAENPQGFVTRRPTHVFVGSQAGAESRALRPAEKRTAVIGQQLHARDARRLAVGHARDWRIDRRCDTARAATGAALHVLIVSRPAETASRGQHHPTRRNPSPPAPEAAGRRSAEGGPTPPASGRCAPRAPAPVRSAGW